MSQALSKRPRTLIKCMYFYKQSKNSPHIFFAILTSDGKYAEFSFNNYSPRLGTAILAKMKKLFMQFRLDVNTDIAFSEEFERKDSIRHYFELIRDHLQYRMSVLKLKKVIRYIAWKHPRSAMMKCEIERKKRGTLDPGRIGVERFNKVWKYLVSKTQGIQCPWITRDVDFWLQNKSASLAKKYRQMRLAMYYMALKNDYYGIEAMRDKRRWRVYKHREEQRNSTEVLSRL